MRLLITLLMRSLSLLLMPAYHPSSLHHTTCSRLLSSLCTPSPLLITTLLCIPRLIPPSRHSETQDTLSERSILVALSDCLTSQHETPPRTVKRHINQPIPNATSALTRSLVSSIIHPLQHSSRVTLADDHLSRTNRTKASFRRAAESSRLLVIQRQTPIRQPTPVPSIGYLSDSLSSGTLSSQSSSSTLRVLGQIGRSALDKMNPHKIVSSALPCSTMTPQTPPPTFRHIPRESRKQPKA